MVLTQPDLVPDEKSDNIIVSIPLWFSRNSGNCNDVLLMYQFPYHYGSRATSLLEKQNIIRELMFPYHYGSRATM